MINSLTSSNTQGLVTAAIKDAATKQDIGFSLLKKSQDIEKAQGEAALKLIDSASSGQIDVHV